MTNQKIFEMRTCVIDFYKFVLNKRYYATHHTVTTAINRFFSVVQAQTVLQIKKSAAVFQVVANLINVIESVSKIELVIVVKKLLTKYRFLRI